MYCQSCQTKLSPRDQRCPTCGRRVSASHDLGAGSSAPGDSQASYPLPPVTSLEEDSMSQTQPKKPKARVEKSKRGGARAAAPDPRLRPLDIVQVLEHQPSLIEPGLEVYREDGEAKGAGYPTEVGDIDLLARDDAGAWVVIQVAQPDRGKELVGELLQRMGWVRRHLGSPGAEVRGIVLLESLPEDLGYAAAAVAGTVEFKLYRLQLDFEAVIL